MRLIIGLLIAFSILFLGTAAIVYLYDHLSDLFIWNSPFWKAWKVPLIVCAVILGVAILLYVNYLSQQKAEKAEKEFAQAQGWGYSVRSDDTEGLLPKISTVLETVSPEKKFDVITAVMTVPFEKGNFFLFGCSYSARSSRQSSKPGSACLIQSDRFSGMRSHVEIFPRNVLDSALTFNKVDMVNTGFAQAYIVSSQDPAEAHRIINESMQLMLVDYKNSPGFIGNFEIALGPGGAVILNWSQALPDDWLALADMARRFASAMR
jgi:hypothetical protein